MDMAGSGPPAKPRGLRGSSFVQAFKQKDFWVLWGPQFAVFVFLLFFYAYGFMSLPSICILLSVFFMMLAATIFMNRKEGRMMLPVAMILPVAIIAGTIGGLYTYDVYAIYPMFYSNARVYTDVIPSQPSAAVADAGKLVFSSSSYVDSAGSVGYVTERGSIFCVAPVRDPTQDRQVEYWAVGISCCAVQGDFWCDASKDEKAKGGIIIFDNQGFFSSSSYDEYDKARKKAEATYGLLSVSDPAYVRWVREDDMEKVANEFRMKAILMLSAWIFLYGGISAGLAYALYKPRQAPQSAAPLNRQATSGGTF